MTGIFAIIVYLMLNLIDFYIICRHTLVGMTLGCARNMPQVFTNVLSKSIMNFVLKVMEDSGCGDCGIENDGGKLNKLPWFVAIKELVYENYQFYNIYHTGTLVSKDYVVTAASIFERTPIALDNYKALVGATFFDVNVANAYPEGG